MCVTVPGFHHSGGLRGHQRAQGAPAVPQRRPPQLHLLGAHFHLLPLLRPPAAAEEEHAVGAEAQQEGGSRLQRREGGGGQRGREDQSAATQPVPTLGEAGAQRSGANQDEALGPFPDRIQ